MDWAQLRILLLVLTGLTLASAASGRAPSCCSADSADYGLRQWRGQDHMFLIIIHWMGQARSHGGRRTPRVASGTMLFMSLPESHLLPSIPLVKASCMTKFSICMTELPRVWLLGGRSICSCFCNPTIRAQIDL